MAIAHFIGGSKANEIAEFENKVDFSTIGYSIKSWTVELPHAGLFKSNDHVFFVSNSIASVREIQEATKNHWELYEAL